MNKTIVVSVGIAAIAALGCLYLYSASNRYTAVNAGNGLVYKVDRRTGHAVAIYVNREIPIESAASYGPPKSESTNPSGRSSDASEGAASRKLTAAEVALLTGQLHVYYGDSLTGNVYNGTGNLRITEVEVTLTTTMNGKTVCLPYKDTVTIEPRTSKSFGAIIVPGDEKCSYSWAITGAEGIPIAGEVVGSVWDQIGTSAASPKR